MKERGFTLVELMVVAALIAMISSIVLSSLGTAKAKGRDSERVQEMKTLQTALELYQLSDGYPTLQNGIAKTNVDGGSGDGTQTLSNALSGIVSSGFISEIPKPPKGGPAGEFYYYRTANNIPGEQNYYCGGKAPGSGGVPYIIYFTTELPKNLIPLTDEEGDEIYLENAYYTYCLTL